MVAKGHIIYPIAWENTFEVNRFGEQGCLLKLIVSINTYFSIVASTHYFLTLSSFRGVAEKFDRSEMSGNIQNTAARDKLNREVQTYFKDTLWALADGDDPAKLEKLVKALIVSYIIIIIIIITHHHRRGHHCQHY